VFFVCQNSPSLATFAREAGLSLVGLLFKINDCNVNGVPLTHYNLAAYTMAPNAGTLKLLRVVVREDFSRNRCETFIRDLHEVRA